VLAPGSANELGDGRGLAESFLAMTDLEREQLA
jgi:hypothetical protein